MTQPVRAFNLHFIYLKFTCNFKWFGFFLSSLNIKLILINLLLVNKFVFIRCVKFHNASTIFEASELNKWKWESGFIYSPLIEIVRKKTENNLQIYFTTVIDMIHFWCSNQKLMKMQYVWPHNVAKPILIAKIDCARVKMLYLTIADSKCPSNGTSISVCVKSWSESFAWKWDATVIWH